MISIIILTCITAYGCSGNALNHFSPNQNAEEVSVQNTEEINKAEDLNSPEAAQPVQADNDSRIINSNENKAGGESDSASTNNITGATLTVNGETFIINLEDNKTAREFAQMFESGPLIIKMSDYGGFEKVGSLGRELAEDNIHMTTQAGDIVLYNGSNIVMFYGPNTWDYTKIGSVRDGENFTAALGKGDVTAVFTTE